MECYEPVEHPLCVAVRCRTRQLVLQWRRAARHTHEPMCGYCLGPSGSRTAWVAVGAVPIHSSRTLSAHGTAASAAFDRMTTDEQIGHVQDLRDRSSERPENVVVSEEWRVELARRSVGSRYRALAFRPSRSLGFFAKATESSHET